jgi:hypothetical protein
MLRNTILYLALGACLALPAWAADVDVMAGYYGNTAVVTGGRAETHWVYNADHTFVMKVPAFGVSFKGTWAVNAATLCRTFAAPPPGMDNPFCTSIEAHKVGDTWTTTVGTESRTISLVQGIQ